MSDDLLVSPTRAEFAASTGSSTGIFVRAKQPDGKWDSVDIMTLDRESLLEWLASRDSGDPADGIRWRESVILLVMGHDP